METNDNNKDKEFNGMSGQGSQMNYADRVRKGSTDTENVSKEGDVIGTKTSKNDGLAAESDKVRGNNDQYTDGPRSESDIYPHPKED